VGTTWLTLFPGDAGTCAGGKPRNVEYAVQVERSGEVDVLYRRLLDLGSVVCREPEDTWMYEPMRFACVDDPFARARKYKREYERKKRMLLDLCGIADVFSIICYSSTLSAHIFRIIY